MKIDLGRTRPSFGASVTATRDQPEGAVLPAKKDYPRMHITVSRKLPIPHDGKPFNLTGMAVVKSHKQENDAEGSDEGVDAVKGAAQHHYEIEMQSMEGDGDPEDMADMGEPGEAKEPSAGEKLAEAAAAKKKGMNK